MVTIQTVRASNALIPSTLPTGLVALFHGGTSGIGLGALEHLARLAIQPRIYILTRRPIPDLLAKLEQSNPAGTFIAIQKDVSLLRDTNDAIAQVLAAESKLDLLFLSAGFIGFDGRADTAEGLDASMTTRYYTRARLMHGLMPLLNKAAAPRVVSVLAGGQEAKIQEDDLALSTPANYSFISASVHSATMGTLFMEKLAAENPRVAFVHTYPGLVATPLLDRGSSGLVGFLLRRVLRPVLGLFAMSAEDAGARVLYYATSERFAVVEGKGVEVKNGEKARKTGGGVFLVNQNGESVGDEKLLGDFRARGVVDKVWEHTLEVFDVAK